MAWTYRSTTLGTIGQTTSPVSANIPSGTTSGDVLVAVLFFQNTGANNNFGVTFTDPSGWTAVPTDSTGFDVANAGGPSHTFFQQIHIAWKVAGGSEPASYSWSYTGPTSGVAYIDPAIVCFTPSAGSITFDASENNHGTSAVLNFGTSAMTIDATALVISAAANWDFNTGQGYAPLSLSSAGVNGWDGVFDVLYSVSGSTTYPANESVTVSGSTAWLTKAASLKITAAAQDTPELYGPPRLSSRQMQQLLAQ